MTKLLDTLRNVANMSKCGVGVGGEGMKLNLVMNESKKENKYYKKEGRWKGGFGGLEVACWLLVPKFAGLNPARVKKNPLHAFLQRGIKAVGPMS